MTTALGLDGRMPGVVVASGADRATRFGGSIMLAALVLGVVGACTPATTCNADGPCPRRYVCVGQRQYRVASLGPCTRVCSEPCTGNVCEMLGPFACPGALSCDDSTSTTFDPRVSPCVEPRPTGVDAGRDDAAARDATPNDALEHDVGFDGDVADSAVVCSDDARADVACFGDASVDTPSASSD